MIYNIVFKIVFLYTPLFMVIMKSTTFLQNSNIYLITLAYKYLGKYKYHICCTIIQYTLIIIYTRLQYNNLSMEMYYYLK